MPRQSADLYEESLYYPAPLLNRVSSIKHKWNESVANQDSVIENFVNDDRGSLSIFETDMAGRMTNGTYEYDILGRLTRKAEAGSDIVFDYVGGGYRTGADGAALFPLTDAQGSIRGYANLSGVRSAHAYYPYGSVEDLSVDAPEDARRWQSKEFDGALGNYYFGARYYDPLLGLWMSPDPAGQFSNPYGYGGDPVNYVDPTGMWALGLGIVVGWDEQHGWQIGFGAALDLSNGSPGNGFGANLSYTWNQDDSESFNMGASGQYLWLAGGLSYSYNSYTGQTLSGNVGVCMGLKGMVGVGPEIGGSLYVNHEGDIMGATAYAELQASAFGGLTSAAVGYESGSMGMEGRGLFAGATVAGVHAEVSERDGRNLSFRGSVYYGSTDEGNDLGADEEHRKVSRLLWIPELGSLGRFKLGASVDETRAGVRKAGKDAVLAMVEAREGVDSDLYLDLVDDYNSTLNKKIDQLSPKMANRLNDWMLSNGMERVWRLNLLHPKEEKRTYRAKGSSTYGNIEIMYGNGYTYSSYNHANNIIDHFFLDMIGYWFSN